MAADPWEIDRLDLAGYLKRLGVPAREPSREARAELHEAHVRAFTFDNIDVLLGQHPVNAHAAAASVVVSRGGSPLFTARSGCAVLPKIAESRR